MKKITVGIRLTEEANTMLDNLTVKVRKDTGSGSRSSVIETLIRERTNGKAN